MPPLPSPADGGVLFAAPRQMDHPSPLAAGTAAAGRTSATLPLLSCELNACAFSVARAASIPTLLCVHCRLSDNTRFTAGVNVQPIPVPPWMTTFNPGAYAVMFGPAQPAAQVQVSVPGVQISFQGGFQTGGAPY